MKKHFRYIIYLILIILVLSPTAVFAENVKPEANFSELTLHSDAILLMEENTGDVLFEKNGYQKMYPASTTKILTAIVVLEKCYLNEVVTMSSTALASVPKDYTISGLKVRRKFACPRITIYTAYPFCK